IIFYLLAQGILLIALSSVSNHMINESTLNLSIKLFTYSFLAVPIVLFAINITRLFYKKNKTLFVKFGTIAILLFNCLIPFDKFFESVRPYFVKEVVIKQNVSFSSIGDYEQDKGG